MPSDGNVRIAVADATGHVTAEQWGGNTVTSGGLSLLRDFLVAGNSTGAPTPPSIIEVGTAFLNTHGFFQTAIPQAVARVPILTRSAVGQAVVYHAIVDLPTASGNTLSGVGLYGGPATTTLGTGTLVALTSMSPVVKTNQNMLQIDWTLTVSGIAST